MSKLVYDKRENAYRFPTNVNKSLMQIFNEIHIQDPYAHITDWKELAQYNWGLSKKNALNRLFVEKFGADHTRANAADPENTVLNLAGKEFLIPLVYKGPVLVTQKPKFTFKSALPAATPAVSIKKLTQWFIPKSENCTIEYSLEGSKERANIVDFEIHTANYYEPQKKENGTELWNTRVICNTQNDDHTTHLFQTRNVFTLADPIASEATQNIPAWDGTSTVTKGALAAGAVINHGCAPYIALVRFYKADGDKNAKIILENFYPHWKQPPSNSTVRALDPQTVIVKWKITGDNGKLKSGLLQLWDKNDTIVYSKALDENTLQNLKQLDIGASWGIDKFDRALMPYRVQIQAHSTEQEAEGLAIAVMHTGVKARVYTKAKMVGFDISPPAPYNGDPNDDTDLQLRCDIMKAAIKEAYNKTKATTNESELKVFMAPEFFFRGLQGAYKMTKDAPGQEDWNLPSAIMKSLREETDKFEYADWLFIFGTVIGYNPYSEEINEKTYDGTSLFETYPATSILETSGGQTNRLVRIQSKHALMINESIKSGVPLKIQQGALVDEIIKCTLEDKDKCWLTLKGKNTAFVVGACLIEEPLIYIVEVTGTTIKVKSKICEKIPYTIGKVYWSIEQSPTKISIKKCEKKPHGFYVLTMDNTAGLAIGKAKLIEPPRASEIFNIALIKKGWPAQFCELTEENITQNGASKQRVIHKDRRAEYLDEAIIYKEHISSIDFIIPTITCGVGGCLTTYSSSVGNCPTCKAPNTHFWSNDAYHDVSIDTTFTKAIPTFGAQDTLGVGANNASEINQSGIGGGSVFTIDGITFGLEVCLDHLYNRLHSFYNDTTPVRVQNGDPKVQIQLIPSWGMRIDGGAIACVDNGLLFNVDGRPLNRGGGSVFYLNKPPYTCAKHTSENYAVPGKCDKESYYCETCSKVIPYNNCAVGHIIKAHRFCKTCKTWKTNLLNCNVCLKPLVCDNVLIKKSQTSIGSIPHTVAINPANCFSSTGDKNRVVIFDVADIPLATSV